MLRAATLVVCMLALATMASASASPSPSFDCAKATTTSEHVICDRLSLYWPDRQMARLYALARKQAPAAGRTALIESQRRFLAARDACSGDEADFCIKQLYASRLKELASQVDVHDAYSFFSRAPSPGAARGWAGWLRIVRFGRTAAVDLQVYVYYYRRCSFEADNLLQGGKGVLRYRNKPGAESCRIDIVPDGDDMRVEVKGCRSHCVGTARYDGVHVFKRKFDQLDQ